MLWADAARIADKPEARCANMHQGAGADPIQRTACPALSPLLELRPTIRVCLRSGVMIQKQTRYSTNAIVMMPSTDKEPPWGV